MSTISTRNTVGVLKSLHKARAAVASVLPMLHAKGVFAGPGVPETLGIAQANLDHAIEVLVDAAISEVMVEDISPAQAAAAIAEDVA
jgi:sirohydrochlorin ferrochelatase